MTPEEYEDIKEIEILLRQSYNHYFLYESFCKSAEGYISVDYGDVWDREDGGTIKFRSITICSSVFCTEGRSQEWTSTAAALATVREWHQKEMSNGKDTPEAIEELRQRAKRMAEMYPLREEKDSGI